jgi:PAS domain S-box-containing protein
MLVSPPLEPVHLRRSDTNERFVAFAFASADMMVETEPEGTVTYATGAFRSKFGKPAEAFVGEKISTLIAPSDQEAVDMALTLLNQRGRLMPMLVRLSDAGRTPLALAGIVLPGGGRSPRLCLTFARPPEPTAALLRPAGAAGFARSAEARLRSGGCNELFLLEVADSGGQRLADGAAFSSALQAVAPNSQANELAPGRYGLLGDESDKLDAVVNQGALEAALRLQGLDVGVVATRLNLSAKGLTPPQAARALRHALNAFTRNGTRGLAEAGLGSELSGYMQRAGRKADILRRVLRDGRFSLSFQPIVSLADRALHHYEALIRPQPIAELPLAGPQDFVMLIEALGLADDLDMRIATLACDRAAEAGAAVSFNVSGQSVQNEPFRKRLISKLTNHKACRAGLVIVEMTETAEIEDVDAALETARALRAIGVPFCLDDFGAGAADMRLLRALTPNVVKLDGSYIPGIASAGRERAFIAGMVELAQAVGADVIAERIETEDEAATLRGLGVQYGQGWLFGRPSELPVPRRVGVRVGETESWG